MIIEKCGICVTRREHDMMLGTDSGECILPLAHIHDVHLFRNPAGQYYIWGDDECDCCKPEDPDRCTWYEKITSEKAEALCAKRD